MKTLTLLCAASLLVAPLTVSAQENNAPGTGAPSGGQNQRKFAPPGGLTPDEAKRLAEAREKAKNDPTVRSLEEARKSLDQQLQNAMRAAILAADPQLAPTLDKVKQSGDRAKGMSDRFQKLPPEKKEALKAAHEAAKQDPAVIAAKQKLDAATSPEEKMQARSEMHEAMRAAVLKKNPDLAPLLDQLGHDGIKGPLGPRPDGGGQRPPMQGGGQSE